MKALVYRVKTSYMYIRGECGVSIWDGTSNEDVHERAERHVTAKVVDCRVAE